MLAKIINKIFAKNFFFVFVLLLSFTHIISNSVFRRVEPTKRTLNCFTNEWIQFGHYLGYIPNKKVFTRIKKKKKLSLDQAIELFARK